MSVRKLSSSLVVGVWVGALYLCSPVALAAGKDLDTALAVQEVFREIADRVGPAVVNVKRMAYQTYLVPRGRRGPSPEQDPFNLFGDDFFRYFFEPQEYERRRQEQDAGLGSGFFVNAEGDLLTNNHVIEGASRIIIVTTDKEEVEGKVVWADAAIDLALVHAEVKKSHPFAVLGDSDAIRVGDWAIAIGNPFGLTGTYTTGIISATGRSDLQLNRIENFIQTDASINFGNSGGPLLNIRGEVVGVNAAIVAMGQGIGFAVPVNMAKQRMNEFRSQGALRKGGWLGIGLGDLDDETAKALGLDRRDGVLVQQIFGGSPAEKAGIEPMDIIVEFNGRKVGTRAELQSLVYEASAGTRVEIVVLRKERADLRRKVLRVTLGEFREATAAQAPAPGTAEETDWLGVAVADPTPELGREHGIPAGAKGVVVVDVRRGSVAAEYGITVGDLLTRANDRPVESVEDFRKAAQKPAEGKALILQFLRRGDKGVVIIRG
jgi:Do/DeqQ family serine protease